MWPFPTPPRAEDPERLRRFLDQLDDADWRGDPASALGRLFKALDELVLHEVRYYYKARRRQRVVSIVTRVLAVVFGTPGVLMPLVAAAEPALFAGLASWGFPFLACAAAMVALNRMFGATGSHIRYVTAQLELERLIAKFRLQWLEWLSRQAAPAHTATPAEAFQMMNGFVDAVYAVLLQETAAWGQAVAEALRDYESRLPAPRIGTGGGSEP